MSGRKRGEVICGLLAGARGLLLLLGAYLQHYGDSRSSAPINLHPGFTPIQYPYLAAIGALLLGIVLGALVDGSHPSLPAHLLLWVATVALTGGTVISNGEHRARGDARRRARHHRVRHVHLI